MNNSVSSINRNQNHNQNKNKNHNQNHNRNRERVAVVFDAWNILRAADEALAYGDSIDNYTVSLPRLAERIVEKRSRRSVLDRVVIVIGVHRRDRNPRARAVQDAMITGWRRDPRCTVLVRENDRFGHEKGVDVEIAGKVGQLRGEDLDTVVLASADSDFQPVLDMAATTRGAHLELARWTWQRSSLFRKGMWVHHLDVDDFDASSAPRNHGLAA